MSRLVAPARKADAVKEAYWNRRWSNGEDARSDSPYYSMLRRADFREKSVIELGCGGLSFQYDLIRECRSYVGIDIASKALKAARHSFTFEEFQAKISLVRGDILNIPLKNPVESFVAIDTMTTLGYDFGEGLRRASEALTKGGVISFNVIHTDWHSTHPANATIPRVERDHGTIFRFKKARNIITFRPDGIKMALKKMGLESIELTVNTAKDTVWLLPYCIQSEAMMCLETPDTPENIMVRAIKL